MPTLGNTTQNATQAQSNIIVTAGDFVMPEGGLVTSFSVYGAEQTSDNTTTTQLAIYEGADLVVSTTAATDWTTTAQWRTYTLTSGEKLYAGVTYTVALRINNAGTVLVGYDTTDNTKYYSGGGSLPDPITWTGAGERLYNIYATYEYFYQTRTISGTISNASGLSLNALLIRDS